MNKKLITLAAAALLTISSVTAQAEEAPRRSLTVSGTATVTAKCDTAKIYLTVESQSDNVKKASRDNAETMTAVRNAVIAAGADASEIETENYNVYPQQTYDAKGKLKSRTYKCTNSMKLEVASLEKTGAVIDAAVEAGASRIDNVEFSVSNTQEYKDEALRQATADALRKARIMAGTLGRSIVNVISVNEDNVTVRPYHVVFAAKMAVANSDERATTPVEAGDSEMESHVTVVFEIG